MRHCAVKRRSLKCGIVAFAAALLLAPIAQAAEGEHAAHVHGVGKLNVAVDGQAVEIELIAPGADIVGFEHAPETAEDKAAVEGAAATLKDGEGLFAFPPSAECRLEEAEVESPLLDHDGEKAHEHGEAHEGDGHAEFQAHYHFVCRQPDRLTHVDIRVFERFRAAQELEVQLISPRGQGATDLTPSSARLKF